MAKNTGRGHRTGSVARRTQFHNPATSRWTKRGPDGRFLGIKADGQPFKGVAREPDGRRT